MNDYTEHVAAALLAVASAIRDRDAHMSTDEAGGTVNSLTEAVMGTTAALMSIARAIEMLSDAVEKLKSDE